MSINQPFDEQPVKPARRSRLPKLPIPRPLLGCLVIIIAVIVCSSTAMIGANLVCYSNLSQRLPLYPNAKVVTREHNLFTEFGMGNTVITLISQDPPDTVRSWYAVHTSAYLRLALQGNEPLYTLAQGQVDVSDNPDGSTGSQVILFGTCVN